MLGSCYVVSKVANIWAIALTLAVLPQTHTDFHSLNAQSELKTDKIGVAERSSKLHIAIWMV